MAKRKNDEYRLTMIQTIQDNITTLMQNKGWENKDLAEASGIALSDLTKYRKPEYNTLPRVTELAKLCETFKVSFDFMIELDPSGRYSKLTDEETSILNLFKSASDRDKMLVKTILEKWCLLP